MKKIIYIFMVTALYSNVIGQWQPDIFFDNTNGYTSFSKSNAGSNYLVDEDNSNLKEINIDSGLIAYYPFDNNANDYSGHSHHGNFQNSAYITTGVIGNGVHLNGNNWGSGGYVSLPASLPDEIRNLNNFSISIWTKEEFMYDDGGEAYIAFGDEGIGLDTHGCSGIAHYINFADYTQNIDFFSGVNNIFPRIRYPVSNINLSIYNHFAMSYENGYLKAFVNGNLVDSTFELLNIYGTNAAIGKHWWAYGSQWSTRLQGVIDEVRIYNRTLTYDEVIELYKQGATLTITSPNGGESLFHNQHVNINWNNIAIDLVKLELSTNNGSSWTVITSNYPSDSGKYPWIVPNITSSQCKIKISDASNPSIYDVSDNIFSITQPTPASALDFDGINDYVHLPDSLTARACGNNTAITIEYWFKGSSLHSAVRFQNDYGYIVTGWNGHHIISSDGATENGISVGASATDGNWHHIAMTWKKNTENGFNSYLDGNLVARRNSANVNLPNLIYGGYLGCYSGVSEFMYGKLDEVRIWNRALSQYEIQQNMNCEIPTTSNGLLANYHFNQGINNADNSNITSVTDFSGNSYHGILSNFTLNGSSSNWIFPGGITNGLNCILNLSVYKPNGGEILYGGHTNEITWNSPGNIFNIKIAYTSNNGSTWNTISSSYPATNYIYFWTIPTNINSSQCKIKISDAGNPNSYDISDSNFSITPVTINSGLVVHYPFDNNFNDASGNGINAIPNGSPTFTQGVIGNAVNLIGDQNNCVNYSGGDRIRTPIFDFLSMNSFTISFWVYDSEILCGAETYFFQGDDWSPNRYIGIWHFYEYIAFSVGTYAQQSNQNFFVPFRETDRNRFVLYTMTYSNGVLKAYRDSEYLGSFNQTVGYSSHYSGLASHGWYSGGTSSARFVGKMDDFRIYNRELSQNEIQQLYNQAAPIIVNSPIVNENLIAGSSKIINWNANSGISYVKIEFSSNNGTNWITLANSFPASNNSYQWTVSNVNSTQCKIRISNTANSSVNAESGVFTITQSNSTAIINLKIKDVTSSVKKVRLQYSPGILYNTIPITNGQCFIKKSDLPLFPAWGKINKIQLLDINNDLVGYINFEYKWSDIYNKTVDAILYVDDKTAYDVGYNIHHVFANDWNYFSNSNEHLVYMLVPPNEKFNDVRNTEAPALFVHGMYGVYPYWGEQPKELYTSFDAWQVYYPYDMRVRDCSYILEKAVNEILSGVPTGNPPYTQQFINIVSHSMGGLVSRYYIQSNPSPKVNKLLMLATPNNGSLASYVSKEKGIVGTLGEVLKGKDRKSPAHIDISPASDFLLYLKTSPVKILATRSKNKSYLVIAGTKPIPKLNIIHNETINQEDGVVAVSSASMLDSLIPLATKYFEHNDFQASIPSQIISAFFDEGYDPNSTPDQNVPLSIIVSNVNGFYTTREIVKRTDDSPGLNKDKGILYFFMPGLYLNSDIIVRHNSTNEYNLDIEGISNYDPLFLIKNKEVSTSYFIKNLTEVGGGFGVKLETDQTERIRLKFRKKYWTICGPRFISIPISTNLFTYKSLQTNWITLNLSPDELSLLNSHPSRVNCSFGSLNSRDNNLFYIDNSIDTISFCLSGTSSDTAFNHHNFQLTDPNNIIIDSVYASQHSNIIYKQSIEDAMAYYYIVNPDPGNWSAQFNENITDPLLIAPIQSPVNPDLQFEDSIFSAGDSIKFFTSIPTESGISNLQYTANVSFIRRGTNTVLDLGNAIMKQVGHYKFEGQFFARGIGEYRVKLDLNCTYNNQNIHRENYNAISVASLRIPSALYPKNDSISVPETATFVWNRNYNSDYYELQIFKAGDTIPAFTNTGITDTSIMISSFERETSYLWRIRAFNNSDTSNWTEPKIFKTIVNPPDNVVLNNPPNNSGGLYTPLSFQWSRSANAEKYHFQISTDSLFGNMEYIDSTITDTMIMINNLNYPQIYFWRVRALNAGGFSDFSDTWTLSTIEPSSQSFVFINVIPQGLYNNLTGSLQRSDTLKAYLVNTSSPFTEVDSSIAVLDSTLLQASFVFNNAESGIYYIKIKHRNSIETWSKEGGEAYNRFGKTYYDFTSAATQAFGNNMIQSGEKWCIYSGDVNQDGLIDLSDIVLIYNDATIFTSGYFVTDLNGDNFTDLTDLLLAFNNSTKFIGKITP